jgi:hypothetical protein
MRGCISGVVQESRRQAWDVLEIEPILGTRDIYKHNFEKHYPQCQYGWFRPPGILTSLNSQRMLRLDVLGAQATGERDHSAKRRRMVTG